MVNDGDDGDDDDCGSGGDGDGDDAGKLSLAGGKASEWCLQ